MKKFVLAMIVGCFCGAALAASVETITIPASGENYLSGSWVNTLQPKRTVQLKSAFVKYASAPTLDSTASALVSKSGVAYTVDTATTTSNGLAYASIDFDRPVYCGYGETVTVSRTVSTTGVVVNVMLVVE